MAGWAAGGSVTVATLPPGTAVELAAGEGVLVPTGGRVGRVAVLTLPPGSAVEFAEGGLTLAEGGGVAAKAALGLGNDTE